MKKINYAHHTAKKTSMGSHLAKVTAYKRIRVLTQAAHIVGNSLIEVIYIQFTYKMISSTVDYETK